MEGLEYDVDVTQVQCTTYRLMRAQSTPITVYAVEWDTGADKNNGQTNTGSAEYKRLTPPSPSATKTTDVETERTSGAVLSPTCGPGISIGIHY